MLTHREPKTSAEPSHGAVFTQIRSNGNGTQPIEVLLERLKTDALDPTFEKYGDFAYQNPCYGVRQDDGSFADGERVFPEHDGVWAFFGNFWALSHAFSIYSNDPAVVKSLRIAIGINKASAAYAAAKAAA